MFIANLKMTILDYGHSILVKFTIFHSNHNLSHLDQRYSIAVLHGLRTPVFFIVPFTTKGITDAMIAHGKYTEMEPV